jgi:hypothetical protein
VELDAGGNVSVPGWVINSTRTNNGVDLPTRSVTIAGQNFRIGEVCKPRDCSDHKITVLIRPSGPAWAMVREGAQVRWFGKPDEAVRRVLTEGL